MSNSIESLTEDISQKRGDSKVDSGYAAESSEVTIGSNGVPSSSAYDFSAADYERIARMAHQRYLYRFIKRAFDILFSLCVIVVFLVSVLLVCLAIYIDDPHGSPLFFQKRVGRHGHEFTMIKLRSMCVDAEERLAELKGSNEKTCPVFKMRDDPRITRVGKFSRKTSIDELPQFINVLLGQMSVVGPRPALPKEVAEYSLKDRLRLAVKPGITCLWQTRRNRDSISFEEWVDLDLIYIQKAGVWTDIKIIIQTVGCVLMFQGE